MSEPRYPDETRFSRKLGDYLSNLAIVGVIRLALALPYALRVRLMGALVRRVIGPLAGYRARALENLALIWPQMPPAERGRIADACLDNVGRTFIENYSAADFPARMASNRLTGAGVAPLDAALAEKRPVILVSGHYGNFEAVRSALVAQGVTLGTLYRNMKNPYFNVHYVKALEGYGGPAFAQGRRGLGGFLRHLKGGGQVAMLLDQHVFDAPEFDFLGHPAQTSQSAAEMALRYDALLLPFYGIRQPDGLTFETVVEAPVLHGDPATMTQALNDSLAARVRADPAQWFWVHRRWRPKT